MSRLQAIENELIAINESTFQELCDSFLVIRNANYSAFSRVGSQSGKRKSIKGTPDTFLLLPNGKYIFVEHSTNISAGLSKLKDDVNKCLDSDKTGIPISQIAEIILCINFNLKTDELQVLYTLLKDTRITLTIYTLDSLSLELHLQRKDLAHQYLGLPLDTGQIVSIDRFINEYNRASRGISTPIDNTFLHRQNELEELKNAIYSNDFVILTGSPGVGKTKLALEGIRLFLSENLKFQAYCISYKHHSLLEDLFQYLDFEKDHILFVDDANRIDAFNQITSYYKGSRKGKLKVVITVRDYAFEEMRSLCQEFAPKRIDVEKFSDEQIIEIISADPFNTNQYYHKQIVQIADGNPRIAIMSALLANEKMDIYALSDLSDLFEKYFSTFIKDEGEFANELNVKCLGLIAFFYTIPYKDRETVRTMLSHFEIEYDSFIEVIDKLDKLELVEIQFDHVKIPEQNLSTYFFYKAFIKDSLLSFKELLDHYFESNKNRFRDCVIPANNTFGVENVMDKLRPSLKEYWSIVRKDEERGFNFLTTFWFYLIEETFAFIYERIESLPIRNNVEDYDVNYETNAFAYERNDLLELIENFFRFQGKELKEAIQLAFEYVRKEQEVLPELIYSIRANLIFDRDDEPFGFQRQSNLFKIIFDGLAINDSLYAKAFFELSKTFMKCKYHHTKGGRHHSFYMYHYPLPNSLLIQSFRTKVWEAVDENYPNYPEDSFNFLEGYASGSLDVIDEIMEFDVDFVLTIIENNLSVESFDHCKYVQEQIRLFQRHSISNPSFDSLARSFRNSTYEIYLKIDWSRFRDKEDYEFEDYREYERLKEEEIRTSFKFKNREEVREFIEVFSFLWLRAKDEWYYNNSLDFVIDENYSLNNKIGLDLLSCIIEGDNKINYVPRVIFRNCLVSDFVAEEIWQLIEKNSFNLKPQWELSFYDYLAEDLINEKYISALLKTISSMQGSETIHFDRLQRFIVVEPDLFQIILKKIVNMNDEGARLRVWMDFFSKHFDKLGGDIDLIKRAYLQQDKIQNHFDYEFKGLLNVLNEDTNFLVEYVQGQYSEERHKYVAHHKHLGFVWQVENIEPVLREVFELVIRKGLYLGILEHFCNSFFSKIPEGFSERAKEFLIQYVKDNHSDYVKMNAIVDIARHSMKAIFDEVLLLFISLNQDVEVFSKIWWTGNGGGVHSGEVNIGDIEAAQWRRILSVVEKSDVGIKLIPIKKYLSDRIESSLRYGDLERKRRFLERY